MSSLRSGAAAFFLALLWSTSPWAEDASSTITLSLVRSDYDGGRIYLPVQFGNVMGSLRLDTGASTTRVGLAPWNKDLPRIAESFSTGASGNTTQCDDVEARLLALRATRGNNVARAKYVVARCAAGEGGDLLGLDFFKGTRLSLNFDSGELVVFPETPFDHDMRPFRLLGPGQRLVGIDVQVGKDKAVGLFDTGAEISAVDQRFLDRHKNLFAPASRKGSAVEASGRRFSPRLFKLKELVIGDAKLKGIYFLAYDFGGLRDALGAQTPFIIGFNAIQKFNWRLDFKSAPSWDAKLRR